MAIGGLVALVLGAVVGTTAYAKARMELIAARYDLTFYREDGVTHLPNSKKARERIKNALTLMGSIGNINDRLSQTYAMLPDNERVEQYNEAPVDDKAFESERRLLGSIADEQAGGSELTRLHNRLLNTIMDIEGPFYAEKFWKK